LIGGLWKVTRHSDGVDLSRLKPVYPRWEVSFKGELFMLFSFVHRLPVTASAGVLSAAQFLSRSDGQQDERGIPRGSPSPD